MSKNLKTYLRTHRRRHGLTQDELGYLVGVHPSEISRMELSRRPPNTRMLVAVESLFGKKAREIFPDFYEKLDKDILENVLYYYKLLRRKKRTVEIERKIDLLLGAVTRTPGGRRHPLW